MNWIFSVKLKKISLSSFFIWNLSLPLSVHIIPPFSFFLGAWWVRHNAKSHFSPSSPRCFIARCSYCCWIHSLSRSRLFIYLYIFIYNSTFVNDDDKTFSFFFLLSVSFNNRKRRERSHQSINQIRKVVVVVIRKKNIKIKITYTSQQTRHKQICVDE